NGERPTSKQPATINNPFQLPFEDPMTRCPIRLLALVACCWLLVVSSAFAAEASDPKLLEALSLRTIGPANIGWRVTGLAVVGSNPSTIYAASASGGLWKTTNSGTTCTPTLDREATVALGDVAVAPSNPEVVYAGTGEGNARNSVSWGDGVYKTTDGGKTWKN